MFPHHKRSSVPELENEIQQQKKKKMPEIERDRLEFVELFAKKKEAAHHFASMSMGNEAEQEAAFNKILNEVSSVMHRFCAEEMEMKLNPLRPDTHRSIRSSFGTRKRISESELPGMDVDRMSTMTGRHGARDSMDPDQLAELAGAPRNYEDDDDLLTDEESGWESGSQGYSDEEHTDEELSEDDSYEDDGDGEYNTGGSGDEWGSEVCTCAL